MRWVAVVHDLLQDWRLYDSMNMKRNKQRQEEYNFE